MWTLCFNQRPTRQKVILLCKNACNHFAICILFSFPTDLPTDHLRGLIFLARFPRGGSKVLEAEGWNTSYSLSLGPRVAFYRLAHHR